MYVGTYILGAVGALMLILSNEEGSEIAGSILGDVICLIAQISFALYLTVLRGLISRNDAMKRLRRIRSCDFVFY